MKKTNRILRKPAVIIGVMLVIAVVLTIITLLSNMGAINEDQARNIGYNEAMRACQELGSSKIDCNELKIDSVTSGWTDGVWSIHASAGQSPYYFEDNMLLSRTGSVLMKKAKCTHLRTADGRAFEEKCQE